MNQKIFNSKNDYPNNIRAMVEEKLSWSKYYSLPGQEELTDDKLIKLIDFLIPHFNEINKSIFNHIKNKNMTLEDIGQKEGITKERVRQILNLTINNMVSDANALFFLLPSSEAHHKLSIIKYNYQNNLISPINRKFTKRDVDSLLNKRISTFKQLYENADMIIGLAENESQKNRFKSFVSDYESQISEYDLWNTY